MVGAKARFALFAVVAFALIAQPSPASAQLDEQLGSLADQAQQTAQEISDSFNQSGSEILNGTEEFAADLGGKLNDTAMAIANKTQQAVSKLNETIQAGAEKIGDFVSDANETIQGAIANGTEGGPPTPCCRAATAECLACSAGVTVEEYCAGEGAVGCDDSSSDDGRRRLQQDMGQNAADRAQEIGQNFADAGKQIADNAVSASEDFVDGLNDTLTEGGAKLNDTLREGASNLNDTLWDGASNLNDALTDGASNLNDTLRENSSNITDAAGDFISGANDTLREGASSLNDTLREGASNAVNKTKDIVSGVGDTLSDGVQNVQDNVSDRRDARKEGDDDDDDDDEEDPPTPCCMAATAECLACSAGVTVEEYCAGEGAVGCDDSSSDDGRRRLQQFDGLENVVGTVAEGVQTAINATTDALQGLGDRVQSGAQNLVNRTETFVSNANDTIQGAIANRTEEGPVTSCCMAATPECLACSAGITVEEFCAGEGNAMGCDDDNEGSSDDGRRRLQQFDGFENVVGAIAGGVQTVVNATTQVLQGVADGISGIGNNNVTDGISGAINSTTGFLSNVGDRIQSGAQNLVNTTETLVSNANDTIQGMISRNRTGRGDDNATMPPQPCCKAMNAKCLSCTENMTEEEYCGMFPETIGCDELGEEEKEGSRRLSLRKLLESPPMEDPVPVADDATAEEGGANVTVEIGSDPPGQMIYAPKDLTINAGDTVVWTNVDGIPHDVVFDSAPDGVDVESISHPKLFNTVGESVSTTFTVPGTYTYFCTPHKYAGMDGTINVE